MIIVMNFDATLPYAILGILDMSSLINRRPALSEEVRYWQMQQPVGALNTRTKPHLERLSHNLPRAWRVSQSLVVSH